MDWIAVGWNFGIGVMLSTHTSAAIYTLAARAVLIEAILTAAALAAVLIAALAAVLRARRQTRLRATVEAETGGETGACAPARRQRTIPLPIHRRQLPANPQVTVPTNKLAEQQLVDLAARLKPTPQPSQAEPAAGAPAASPDPAPRPRPGTGPLRPIPGTGPLRPVPGVELKPPAPAAPSRVETAPSIRRPPTSPASPATHMPTPAALLPGADFPDIDLPAIAELPGAGPLTIVRVRSGALEQAESSLKRLLASNPQHAQAWFWLGCLNARRDQVDEARRCFEHAHRLNYAEAAPALDWCRRQSPPTGSAAA